MERETKPHTRQKMKLVTQKKQQCVECKRPTYRRHVLLCFHVFCPSCYSSLSKALCNSQLGVQCSVCKTFDPNSQREERDDLPNYPCRVHPGKRHILYCEDCNTRLCYSCKMGKHFHHKCEMLQDTVERTAPLIQEKAQEAREKQEEEERERLALEIRRMEKEREIARTQRKAERLGAFLKEQHRLLEQSLKEHYQKVQRMVEQQAERRKRVLQAQAELISHFQYIRLPYHSQQDCPQQGAIQLQWHGDKKPDECMEGACVKPSIHQLEEVFKIKQSQKKSGAGDDEEEQKQSKSEDHKSIDKEEKSNGRAIKRSIDNAMVNGDLDPEPKLKEATKPKELKIETPDDKAASAKLNGSTDPKPGNMDDLVECILQRDQSRAVATLCGSCVAKHESLEDGVDYAEVYNALSSGKVTEIGEVLTDKEAIFVRYTPANIDTSNLLDKVDFDKNGNLIDSKSGNIIGDNILGKVEIVCQPTKRDPTILQIIEEKLTEKAEKENSKKELPASEKCPCFDKITFNPGDFSIRNSKVNLESLAKATLKHTGTITYDNKLDCNCLGYFNGDVWLANSGEQCEITVMNSSSVVDVETVPVSPDIKEVHGIHPYNSNQLLLAARTGVYLVDSNAHVVGKLMRGSFRAVCHQGPLVGMLESVESHVKVMDTSTDPPTLRADFHILVASATGQALAIKGQCIFLATSDHRIKKYDLEGDLLWQWGGEGENGPGELSLPLVSAVDDTESLLVVDRDNKRLQLVDSHCHWQLLDLEEIKRPADAVVTDEGVLLVLNTENRSIYRYTNSK